MNLANKLTIWRIILIPFFLICFYIPGLGTAYLTIGDFHLPYSHLLALIIFLAAAITDFFDGHIARKYNMITDFGKFMDPLADKLLVTAAFLIFIELDLVPAWVVFIILAREFMVTGLRTIAASKGVIMAAGWTGKLKTVVQFVMIAVLLLLEWPFASMGIPIGDILIWLAVLLTVASGAEYLLKNLDVLKG